MIFTPVKHTGLFSGSLLSFVSSPDFTENCIFEVQKFMPG